jgi:hypothetical protein
MPNDNLCLNYKRMTWGRNDFNPFWREMYLGYGVDSIINLPCNKMTFFIKEESMVYEMDLHDFKTVLDGIVYKSKGNPILRWGGLIGEALTYNVPSEDDHTMNTLSFKSGSAQMFNDWIKKELLPKLKTIL